MNFTIYNKLTNEIIETIKSPTLEACKAEFSVKYDPNLFYGRETKYDLAGARDSLQSILCKAS